MPTLVSLLPSDLARTRGGAERYAVALHDALTQELPDWRTRGLVAATEHPERHLPAGWSAVGGPGARRLAPGDAIGAATTLRHTLRGADVVVCHGWRTRSATILRAAAAAPRRRTTFVAMDHGAGTRVGYALSWLPLPGAGVGAHQSAFEASVSPIRARAHATIRGGVDERRFRPDDSVAQDIDVLMVGRFLPYKGQLRFLQHLPDGATAMLIGPSDSTDPDYLQEVRALAQARGVTVRFDVGDDDLAAAYRSARHTVQVPIDFRRYDGAAPPELLGLTMLEAMASGSVPICPGTGASAEFVTDGRNGLTYEAGSADALAAVLRRALVDRDGHAALRQGALAEAHDWTWAAAARALIAALPPARGQAG
jgi:glycosyltransferase involved in cell wall biosynthesis